MLLYETIFKNTVGNNFIVPVQLGNRLTLLCSKIISNQKLCDVMGSINIYCNVEDNCSDTMIRKRSKRGRRKKRCQRNNMENTNHHSNQSSIASILENSIKYNVPVDTQSSVGREEGIRTDNFPRNTEVACPLNSFPNNSVGTVGKRLLQRALKYNWQATALSPPSSRSKKLKTCASLTGGQGKEDTRVGSDSEGSTEYGYITQEEQEESEEAREDGEKIAIQHTVSTSNVYNTDITSTYMYKS